MVLIGPLSLQLCYAGRKVNINHLLQASFCELRPDKSLETQRSKRKKIKQVLCVPVLVGAAFSRDKPWQYGVGAKIAAKSRSHQVKTICL